MLFICINFPRQAGKNVTSRDSFWRSLPRPYASVYGLEHRLPTPWISLIVCTPKKDGGTRICVDMRAANQAISHKRHVMPTLSDFKALRNQVNLEIKQAKVSFYRDALDSNEGNSCETWRIINELRRSKRNFFYFKNSCFSN